ncbi:MAG: multidrug DMT transporter permease [Planctomycetia bacterium]|nr:multidrug DMT transporter permease [Planctomycetia bacterium]
MFLLEDYWIAVTFCVVTMLCWGSWGNTQKAVGKTWRFELFYWDYVLGVTLMSLAFAFTLGSNGEYGRAFLADLRQASPEALGSAFLGGVVFNIANILLVAAIAIAGMSVAFPIGIGLALVLGVLLNYAADQAGNPVFLFGGVVLVTLAILLNAFAYGKLPKPKEPGASKKKGIILALVCGVLMSTFYYFVANSLAKVEFGGEEIALTLENLKQEGAVLQAGKLTPYTGNVVFSLGVLLSSFFVVTFCQLKPFVGEPVSPGAYFKGTCKEHLWGLIGGAIWAVGMSLSVLAAGVASPAVSYGLGQGATVVSAIWGVFIWREFKSAPKGTAKILLAMFLCFLLGLGLIICAKM